MQFLMFNLKRNKPVSLDYGRHLFYTAFYSRINLWLEIFFYPSGHPLLKGIPSPSVMIEAIFCLESHAHQEVHGVSLLGHGTWKRLPSGQKLWRLRQCLQVCKKQQRPLNKRHAHQAPKKKLGQRKQELQHLSRKLLEHQAPNAQGLKKEQVLDLQVRITNLRSRPALLKGKLLILLLLLSTALSKMTPCLIRKLYCLIQFNFYITL